MSPAQDRSELAPAPVFPNYLQMRRRIPVRLWHVVRICSVATFILLCVTLVVRPAGGLFVFWQVIVPCLPLLFFLAPGLWRNICPLAAANQTPRLLCLTRGLAAQAGLKERGYVLAIAMFLAIVAARKVLFNTNGTALAVLLITVILAAFAGGMFLKGKSGWCSTLCPLLPVQRLYGQTPFVTVPNSHCQPCVGCTKNCYDFNPLVAYQADMYDGDPHWSGPRALFAGVFPGLVLAFFTIPSPPVISRPEMLLRFAAYVLVGAGSFFALDAVLRVTRSKLAAIYGAAALTIFYWYSARTIAGTIEEIFGNDAEWVVWPLRAVVFGLALVWVFRVLGVEKTFVQQSVGSQAVRLAPSKARDLSQQGRTEADPEVRFVPEERRVVAGTGATLLEVAEGAGLSVEAGCRMGMCGSDPIAVRDGMANLSPVGEEEASTLRRLGLAESTRMACCARVQGDVCVSLTPDKADPGQPRPRPRVVDPSVRSVVVLGNGIAGITAADFTRRNHPDCEIHVVGRESHPLYNRMGISRLIYGRSAMQGLYLLPQDWYDEQAISCWLNTRAQRIDLEGRKVVLGTGEELPFDRLILAMGSSSLIPKIAGYGRAGSFVLREADDAIRIRSFVQEHGARRAVVAGGGLLGLEAAYALRQLGLRVVVVERSSRLLSRQVDERCSGLLGGYFEGLGIHMVYDTGVVAVEGDDRVTGARLGDGTLLECDTFLVCAGITPNADLAREAGLNVNRGVVVDDRMATGVPGVYAAGDVAELEGQVLGLWPIAVSQAEVAATNAVGGDELHARALPVTILKGVGIDLISVGQWQADGAGDADGARPEEVVVDTPLHHSYGKLLISDGRLVGAILLGRPHDGPHVVAAVKKGIDVSSFLDSLRRGDFTALDQQALVGTTTPG